MFPHTPLLGSTVLRPVRPQLDLWEKPERLRGFLALLYLHSAFTGRLKDAQLFFLRYKTAFKNTPFSIIFFFYVTRVIFFLSYAAVTFLSLTLNSCHCTLLFHFLAQVQPHYSTTTQQSVGKQCRDQQFRQTTFTTMGRWHRKIWDTEGGIHWNI